MSHLLYSSNEMYSSTELIRKSKTIFNKIINNEIDKAIIMRDGKPSFMLLDFDKYEKIMAEYDKLSGSKEPKDMKKKKQKDIYTIKKEPKTIKIKEVIKEKKVEKVQPSQVVPPTPTYIDEIEEEIIIDEEILIVQPDSQSESIAEKEVQEGLEVLDDLDFDDEFKKEVEKKVREKKSREIAKKPKVEETKEVVEPIKKEKKKAELKEFWA